MKIALDYDGTYTSDPELWDLFIEKCKGKHEVVIVTMRYPYEPIDISIPIIYTCRKAKKLFCESLGLKFNIWIDDNPEWLFTDSY